MNTKRGNFILDKKTGKVKFSINKKGRWLVSSLPSKDAVHTIIVNQKGIDPVSSKE